MFRPDELVVDLRDRIRRKRETYARVGVSLTQNRGVNADNLAVHIDQRTTGIAWVNSGVGLNERLELAAGNDIPALSGNNARGYRADLAERTADGQHPITDLHTVRVPQFGHGHRAIHVNFDDGEIGFLIFS